MDQIVTSHPARRTVQFLIGAGRCLKPGTQMNNPRPITLKSLMAAYRSKPKLRQRLDSGRLRALLRELLKTASRR